MDQLMRQITLTDIPHHVVSVWGTAGVGKSVLVRTVFYHCVVSRKFEKYAWVHAKSGIRDLYVSLCLELNRSDTKYDHSSAINMCHFLLHRHCCLVVVDHLEVKADWENVRANLSLGTSRSCIVVVTRDESVARHCATTNEAVYHVKDLESDEALHLFIKGKENGKAGTFNWDHKTKEEARLFINKCGRLRREAAHALDSYLLASQTDKHKAAKQLNANFLHELEIKPELRQLQDSLTQMHSSFRRCPQILKKCTFYLSIFPQRSIIRRSRLVRRWVAEGYSECTDSNSMVKYTEKLLYKLADLGILGQQPQISIPWSGGLRATSWEVYSLVLEYIISREREENILLPLEISVLEGESSLKTEHVGQHLAIMGSWEREEYMFDRLDFSRLRSLTVSGEWQTFFISDKMRVLRVLDLEGTLNIRDGDLEPIGKMLPRLKFLSLRGCKEVFRLPDSLGDLRQLQTLDIRDTKVIKLPRSIMKLQKLQYFRAGTTSTWVDDEGMAAEDHYSRLRTKCFSWFKSRRQGQVGNRNGVTMPRGIGQLKALHKMGVVNVPTTSGEAILAELHNHKQLKNLHVSGVRIPGPPSNRLNMFSLFSSQSWNIKFPQNLMKLNLAMPDFCLSKEYIQAIGKLEKMHTIRLRVSAIQGGLPNFFCFMQERVDASTYSARPFGKLKLIEIVCVDSLHATFYEGASFEDTKLSLERMRYLSRQDMQDFGMPKGLYTLCLRFLGNHEPLLQCSRRVQVGSPVVCCGALVLSAS